ncbi:MAG: phosphoglucosamine mutase [Deinococcales bacterium]
MERHYFGTDGVRGVAGQGAMSADFVFKLGMAAAEVLKKREHPRFIIGRDTRLSGMMLQHAVSAGLCARGAEVIDLGIIPTPGVSFLCKALKADAGIVISASHNPFEDNGIKFFDIKGEKLSDELELEIERLLAEVDRLAPITAKAIGRSIRSSYAEGSEVYLDFLKSQGPDLSGFKIGLDCANGASYDLAPRLFRALGAQVSVIHASPDGLNINVACGSTHPEHLQDFVKVNELDLGICFDGDADRSLLVDKQGRMVTGDHILAMTALNRKETAVVSTIMANMGVESYLKARGVAFHRAKVGDRYVKEMLIDKGLKVGGEQSGHVLFLDKAPTGDGMLSALEVLKAMMRFGGGLEPWVDQITLFPQILVNVTVPNQLKHQLAKLDIIQDAVAKGEAKLGEGRINLRPSGTEPLLRVMVEGRNQSLIEEIAHEIAKVIEDISLAQA